LNQTINVFLSIYGIIFFGKDLDSWANMIIQYNIKTIFSAPKIIQFKKDN